MEAATMPAAGLDPAFVEEWARRFMAGWNASDSDAVAALCSEDVVWHDPVLPGPARSRDDVREFVTATGRAFPDFRLEWRSAPWISPADPVVLIRQRMTGTMRGTWSYTGLNATGRPFEALGVDEFWFRDGLLWHCRSYYDRLDMARQLGVVPPVGSGGEHAMTRLQNLRTRLRRRRA